jgi:hypothetical protein
MSGTTGSSLRREQQQLAQVMRERHKTWGEAAAALRDRYSVNARVAYRLVHGWSQREAADKWNERWPAEPKTFKNFSYWEVWPAKTGHAPSLSVLTRLAELYECRLADLLADCADFRDRDIEYQARAHLARLPVVVTQEPFTSLSLPPADADGDRTETDWPAPDDDRLAALVAKVEQMSAEELAHAVASWAGTTAAE